MERKKRSKGSLWEFCYANKIFGTFGDEIKACGQKLANFAHTHAAKLVVEIITTAIISSKLDYFILKLTFSLQSSSMSRHVTRQRVQNCLGIVVTQCLLYSHSPPIRNVSLDVHGWYRTWTLADQALSSMLPASLHSLLILAKKATLTLFFVVKFKTMVNPHQRIRAPVEEIEYPRSGGGSRECKGSIFGSVCLSVRVTQKLLLRLTWWSCSVLF